MKVIGNSSLRKSGFGAATLALASVLLTACGSDAPQDGPHAVTGVVSSGSPVSGSVSLSDSSVPAKSLRVAVDESGAFSFDIRGLTPPFFLASERTETTADGRLSSVSSQGGRANINPLTSAAYTAARGDDQDEGDDRDEDRRRYAHGFERLIGQLQVVLKPLFDRYGVPEDPFTSERPDPALRALLKDVRISVRQGQLVVTNAATGAVIYSGTIHDLASGTFNESNMPAGPGTTPTPTPDPEPTPTPEPTPEPTPIPTPEPTPTPPPPAACSYTYSDWTACANGTQTRTVIASSPSACTGTPLLSQGCTVVPPPPATCSSFTYSAWGACQSNGTQTRTVTASSPSGCTGGTPVLSQACTYTPPAPATCSSFTYSAWGACQSNGTQTRTVAASSPSGCTGGTPVLSQACTYTPPAQSCGSCHGVPPSSGRHSLHVSRGISCSSCHGSGYSSTTANAATHMNGTVNLTAGGTSCNTCHGAKSW
jgi:hypothetical protein